jgi:hypothetical protein
MVSDGLIHFFRVQLTVANQFAREQQYRDFVPEARPGVGLQIHIDDIEGYAARGGHLRKLAQHFLAKAAPGAGVQQESQGARRPGLVVRQLAAAIDFHGVSDELHCLRRNLAHRRDLVPLYDGRERVA